MAIDTSTILPGTEVKAAPLKDALDNLESRLAAVEAAPVITNSATSAFSAETTLTNALVSPPAIGGTTPAAVTGTSITATTALILSTLTTALAVVSGAAATLRGHRYQTAGVDRWQLGANATAEGGSNAGSNFEIRRYSDVGAVIDAPLTITRSNGNIATTAALAVGGALSKGSGSFKISHPLDEGWWLYHSFIEGPKCDLIYRGTAALKNGQATVDLNAEARMRPGTFEALCQNPQVWLQNESGWEPLKGSVAGAILTIVCRDAKSDDDVSWMVVAERADQVIRDWELTDADGRLIPEHPKTEDEKRTEAEKLEKMNAALG